MSAELSAKWPSFGIQNHTKNVYFYIILSKKKFGMVDFNTELLNRGGYWGPSWVNDRFHFKILVIERCNYQIPQKLYKQPDENITTWNCSQALLITALYHIIFSVHELKNSEYWIFFVQKYCLVIIKSFDWLG